MGVIIGLERQFRQHPAGLRTNALVCVGAALFVSLTRVTNDEGGPARMAGYVVSGIGFLGGGVILREGLTVKGMNTAATLWCTAAIGVLSGAGYPLHAAVGALIVLAVHLGLRPVDQWADARTRKRMNVEISYRICVVCERRQEAVVRTILLRHVNSHPAMTVQGFATQDAELPDQTTVVADIFSTSRDDRAIQDVMSRMNIEPGVIAVRWEQGRGPG